MLHCVVSFGSLAPNLQPQFQAFPTCYEVWNKAKKVYSNDVHRLYNVITSLKTMELENMDMQTTLVSLNV